MEQERQEWISVFFVALVQTQTTVVSIKNAHCDHGSSWFTSERDPAVRRKHPSATIQPILYPIHYKQMPEVIILGAGGHAEVVADILLRAHEAGAEWKPIGFLHGDSSFT